MKPRKKHKSPFSIEGYKFNSPDRFRPFNIIDSGRITMKDVNMPLFAVDNEGNQGIMMPGEEYQFPGDRVLEVPLNLVPPQPKSFNYFLAGTPGSYVGEANLRLPQNREVSVRGVLPMFPTDDFKGVGTLGINQNFNNYSIGANVGIPFAKNPNTGERTITPRLSFRYNFDSGGSLRKAQTGKEPKAEDLVLPNDATSVYMPMLTPEMLAQARGVDEPMYSTDVSKGRPYPMPAEEYATAYEPPSTARKVLNRAANPMTTLGYVVRGQDIPDRVPDKDNPLDMAVELVNPFALVDYVTMSGESLGRGDYVGAGFNALAGIPGIPSTVKAAPKVLRPAVDLFHPVGRDLRRIRRQGVKKGLSPMEIKQQQMREVGITSEQRKGYFPGVSEIATEYYTPVGYENVLERLTDIPIRIRKGEKNIKVVAPDVATWVDAMQTGKAYNNAVGTIQSITKPRYDAWRMYSGMPQEFGTFRLAETLPVNHPSYSSKQLANLERFSINDELKLLKDSELPSIGRLRQDYHMGQKSPEYLMESAGYWKNNSKRLNDLRSEGIRISNDVSQTNIMGGHNQRFFDDVLEYNDIWDLHPGGFRLEDFYGKPFLSHGRMPYALDDIIKANKKVVDHIEHLEKNPLNHVIPQVNIDGIQRISGNSPGGRLRNVIQSGKPKKMLGGSLPKAQPGIEFFSNDATSVDVPILPHTMVNEGIRSTDIPDLSSLFPPPSKEYLRYKESITNPNQMEGESDEDYKNRYQKNFVERRNREITALRRWTESLEADIDELPWGLQILAEIGVSPLTFAEHITDYMDLGDTQKYKNDEQKSKDLYDTIDASVDVAGLFFLLASGNPSGPIALKAAAKKYGPAIYKLLFEIGAEEGIDIAEQEKWLGKSRTGLPEVQKGKEIYQPTSFTDYLNPMNWGVPNRDDAGSFDEAFAAARNAGDDEFMWYGNRYNTKLDLTPPEPLKGITNDLLMKQAFVESSFKPKRVSGAGAKGLTQFTDRTLAELRRLNLIDDSFDIYNNADAVRAQKLYMQHIYDRPYIDKEANESEKVRIAKTLAAYNWGPEELRLYLNNKKAEGMNIYDMGEWIDNLPKETREYIGMILLNQPSEGRPQVQENFIKAITGDKYKDIISLYDYDGVRPLGSYQTGGSTYRIKPGDTLSKIANRFGTSVQELVDLNKIDDPDFIVANQNLSIPNNQPLVPIAAPVSQSSSAQVTSVSNPSQGQDIYTVRPGDTLSQIAKVHGTTVNRLKNLNQLDNPNMIFPNQQIILPKTIRMKPPTKAKWVSVDEADDFNNSINNLSDEEIVVKAQILADPNERFVVVDKKNKMFKYYQGDNLLMEFEIITGKDKGDAQTVTKAIDINNDGIITDADRVNGEFEVDWSMGNLNTGAGVYTIDESMATTDYDGYYQYAPSFTLLNERGTPVGTAIHGTPKYREEFFDNNNLDDNRQSSGCINGKCTDIQALYDMGLAKGTSVYILPEDAGNRFEFVDGQAVLRMSKENRKKYAGAYTDEKGREQTGQGGNYSINTLKYRPIRAKFDEESFKKAVFQDNDADNDAELMNTTMPFINALVENKKEIMVAARIPGDIYNQIAKMAFGIYGAESNFGDTHGTGGNIARFGNKALTELITGFMKDSDIPIPKVLSESKSNMDVESEYAMIKALPEYVEYFESLEKEYPRLGGMFNMLSSGVSTFQEKLGDDPSLGYTQLRWNWLDAAEKEALEKVGITSIDDFMDPEKAAIGTATILGVRYNTQYRRPMEIAGKDPTKKENIWKHLPSKWNSNPKYSDRVKKNSRFLDFEQLTKLETGGEINHYDMYSDYIDGKFDGTDMEEKAKSIYDKLNRMHYSEAKYAKHSVPNYILSEIIPSMRGRVS